jgi:hypothetical protein
MGGPRGRHQGWHCGGIRTKRGGHTAFAAVNQLQQASQQPAKFVFWGFRHGSFFRPTTPERIQATIKPLADSNKSRRPFAFFWTSRKKIVPALDNCSGLKQKFP